MASVQQAVHTGLSRRDVLIQSSRLGLGLSAQLAPEHADADLVLLQRGASPALPRIETHQRSMRGLLQWVERQETDGGLDGALRRLALGLVGEQPGERLEGELSEPLALSQEPLLERWFVEAEPFEQLALVESRGPFERLCRALGRRSRGAECPSGPGSDVALGRGGRPLPPSRPR